MHSYRYILMKITFQALLQIRPMLHICVHKFDEYIDGRTRRVAMRIQACILPPPPNKQRQASNNGSGWTKGTAVSLRMPQSAHVRSHCFMVSQISKRLLFTAWRKRNTLCSILYVAGAIDSGIVVNLLRQQRFSNTCL